MIGTEKLTCTHHIHVKSDVLCHQIRNNERIEWRKKMYILTTIAMRCDRVMSFVSLSVRLNSTQYILTKRKVELWFFFVSLKTKMHFSSLLKVKFHHNTQRTSKNYKSDVIFCNNWLQAILQSAFNSSAL